MALSFEALIGVLEEMVQVYQALNRLSVEMQSAIIAGETEQLSTFVQQETRYMYASGELEKKRLDLVAPLAKAAGAAPEDATVTLLSGLASPDERARLLALRDELSVLVQNQKDLNTRTRNLLEAHVEYADMMLNLMVGPEDPLNNLYGAQGLGEKDRRQTPGLFDTQI